MLSPEGYKVEHLPPFGPEDLVEQEEERGLAPFPFTLFADIELHPRKNWLIRDVLGEGELSVLYGSPGCRKSVIAQDAGCHVSAGLPWLGKAVWPCGVLYVA